MVPAGAYGFKMQFQVDVSDWLANPPASWATIDVRSQMNKGIVPSRYEVREDSAVFPLESGGMMFANRVARTTIWTTPYRQEEAALIHPGLALAAGIFSRWDGDESFHAGGFFAGEKAWGLCGDRGAGKSSLLASMAIRGIDVLSDDLLVVRNGLGMAGPRCIDLRGDSYLLEGLETAPVRYGERQRLRLSECSPEVPLAGWILLDWGQELSVSKVSPSQRLQALAAHRYWLMPTTAPAAFLDAASLPMYRLARPKDASSTPLAIEALLSL